MAIAILSKYKIEKFYEDQEKNELKSLGSHWKRVIYATLSLSVI